jgi:hypothetical protein
MSDWAYVISTLLASSAERRARDASAHPYGAQEASAPVAVWDRK